MIPADIQVDYEAMEDESGNCVKCGHRFGPHILMATMITADHGGLIFCQTLGCLCQSTWSLDGEPMPYIPDEGTIVELRAIAQSDDEPESSEEWDPERDVDIWP